MTQWAAGQFTSADMGETAQLNAQAIGRVQELGYIGEIDYEEFRGIETGD